MTSKSSKGKAVDPNERTRLLPEASSSSRSTASGSLTALEQRSRSSIVVPGQIRDNEETAHVRRNRLITALIVICTILLTAILFLGLLLSSYAPSPKEKDSLSDAVLIHGPTDIKVLNITSTGIWLEVEGYAGVDVDRILGIHRAEVGEGERGGGAKWWERLRTEFGRLAIDLIGPVEVREVQGLQIWSTSNEPERLVSVKVPNVIPIPLATQVEALQLDHTIWEIPPWLAAIRVPVHINPEATTSKLVGLAKKAWKTGSIDVEIRLASVTVQSRHSRGWRGYVKHTERNVRVPLSVDVPALKEVTPSIAYFFNLPHKLFEATFTPAMQTFAKYWQIPDLPNIPRGEMDLAKLIRLESYNIETTHLNGTAKDSRLQITALASMPNPVLGMQFDLPYSFGFGIFLRVPSGDSGAADTLLSRKRAKMAEVVTDPISLHGQQRINVHIRGFIQSDRPATDTNTSSGSDPALSMFLRNYLHGLDNPVVVQGLPYLPWNGSVLDRGLPAPPSWMSDIVQTLQTEIAFPGPHPAPKLIKSVTIQNMRISESRGQMRASGLVVAEIELPAQLRGVEVAVTGVLPDVLVFDGYPPDDGDVDPDDLPYPLRAFGRIHPDDYLPATSQPSQEHTGILMVEAPIHDVPVQVLSGRDKVMSDFVSKIIFKGGALAGIKGRAAVSVIVPGMASEVQVTKIPVSGDFTVGKPRFGS